MHFCCYGVTGVISIKQDYPHEIILQKKCGFPKTTQFPKFCLVNFYLSFGKLLSLITHIR